MAAKNISTDTITKNTMSKKAAAEECLVCCEPFNKSCHLPVECEQVGCKYKACLECVRAYLLTSVNEPHCMECKVNWSAKFMLVLRKGWLSDTYRPHREKFLCDIELAKLAETMPAAENYKAWKNQEAVVEVLRQKYLAVKRELDVISDEYGKAARLSRQLKDGKENKEEKKEFFMPCPAVNCNGLLSTQYKCGICDMFTCADCHEVIGASKTEDHTCDPNNVASALAIKKETKQCPGCHNRIYRIEGCSQMWCTGCHTAFDWNTGRKVETGQLHNPHWLEYQRGLGTVPRAPGDVPCGGLCSYNDLNRNILAKIRATRKSTDSPEDILANERISNTLRYIHRLVENITNNDVRETRERNQSLINFKDQRVKYIVGEMTKQQFSTHIFRSDKTRQKNTEMLNVYELLSAVGIDVNEQIANYDKLRSYCNGLFAVIGNTYGMTVPQFSQYWSRQSGKFNSKTLKMVAGEEASC
jgi:hypothetical protein